MDIFEWAKQWRIPFEAIKDLEHRLGMDGVGDAPEGPSEAAIQAQVRLQASRMGGRLWRNNSGAGKLSDGSFIRWGLANDSARVNKHVKSSDLIGIMPRIVTIDMLGHTVGIFTAREVKAAGWRYTGTEREQAQLRWLQIINSLGGDAQFVSAPGP